MSAYNEAMYSIKNFFRVIIIITFGWVLFITPIFYAVYAFTAQPDTLKQILTDSTMYETAVPALLETSLERVETEQEKALLSDPTIQQIANETLSPGIIRTASEAVVDGTYAWLNGEVKRPQFTIDLTAQRDQLAAGLDRYATARVESLPVCTREQSATYSANSELLNLTCVPAGVNTAQLTANFGNKSLVESDILQDPILTADDILDQDRLSDKNAKIARERYQAMRSMVFALVFIALGLAVGILLLTPERAKGLRLIGRTLLIIAILLAVTAYGTIFLFERSNTTAVGNAGTAFKAAVADAAISTAHVIGTHVLRWTAVYLLAGLAVYFVGRLLYSKKNAAIPPQPPKPPAPSM